MNTRWFTGMFLAVMLVAGLSACAPKEEKAATQTGGTQGGIAWMDFDQGMAKAKEAGKPVMIDFYTTWCKYCKMLDESTYKDPEIISILNEHFVAIKVDAESSDTVTDKGQKMTKSELAQSYKVTGYPTIWFFDETGAPIAPLPGYSPPSDFKPVLTYISSGAYSQGVKYKDYLDSLPKTEAESGTGEKG